MPTFRSLFLHLAIAAGATIMVAAAAVAVGLSGAHAVGGQIEPNGGVRFASGDWPKELLPAARAPHRGAGLDRQKID